MDNNNNEFKLVLEHSRSNFNFVVDLNQVRCMTLIINDCDLKNGYIHNYNN